MQASTVVRNRKETRGSRTASTSMVPAGQQTARVMRRAEGKGVTEQLSTSLGNPDRKEGAAFPAALLQVLKAKSEKLPLGYREEELGQSWGEPPDSQEKLCGGWSCLGGCKRPPTYDQDGDNLGWGGRESVQLVFKG